MAIFKEGQKTLIIRYGKKADCIEKHKEVIESIGYCWFGKIGVVPGRKAITSVQAEDNPMIILYSQGKGYIAFFKEITYQCPTEGYPQYYEEELFEKLIFPKCYFKITAIEKIETADLAKFRIVSSGNDAISTLGRSMASFFYAEYGKSQRVISVSTCEKKKKTVEEPLNRDSCIYKKDGKCTRRSFVNYKYECERPNNCAGQVI